MVPRKLIFLDIDGTLCIPGQNVPVPSAMAAIAKARQNGHLVLLCSGRNRGMQKDLLAYGFDGVVSSAGGHIEVGGRVLFDNPMPAETLQRVRAALDAAGLRYAIECLDETYASPNFFTLLIEKGPTQNSEAQRWTRQQELSLGVLPLASYTGGPVYKVMFLTPGEGALAPVRAALEPEFRFVLFETRENGLINGEMNSRAFSKGTAVERVAAHLGIGLADTIAFGDSMNDAEMLQTAGLSFCMENGAPEVKALAHRVCPAVQNDGLACAFEALGLLG